MQMKTRKSMKYMQESTKFNGKARGEHINMPGIDTIIGGSHGAVVRIVSERNERYLGRQSRCLHQMQAQ